MRKVLAAAMLIATVAQFGTSQAAPTNGSVALPSAAVGSGGKNPGAGDTTCNPATSTSCNKSVLSRHARCAYLANKQTNGVFGYVVPVSAAANTFTLRSNPANTADFDIAFYQTLGTCEGPTPRGNLTGGADPDTCFGAEDETGACIASQNPQYVFSKFGNGTESGAIPNGARFAIITLFGGANANFVFTPA